jgi:pimeloyl-ACP methyl ester carboxylesterase
MHKQVIELNGATLAYRESGRGIPPMVLVHANISDMRSWEPIEPMLARHFRVINYSRRYAYPNLPIGVGIDDTLSQHADDLISLIERVRLGKVHLVGNSSGAFVCLLVARRRPDLVRTLTLEEPPVVSMFLRSLPPKLGEAFKLMFASPFTFFELLKFGIGVIAPATKAFQNGNDGAALNYFASGVLGEAAHAKITAARRQQMIDNVRAHRAALLGAGLPVFTPRHAAAIGVPTQLLCGSDTPAFQQRINQRLAELIPGAQNIHIPNASHFVHEDNPAAVADVILNFCQRYG